MTMTGTVFLVGAGPGDPGLITVRGRDILARADVVVYDRLIGAALLEYCRPGAERIFVGKEAARHALPQEAINELLVIRALAGQTVCRLKGGDPFVFGRGGEEALHCRAHGVPFEIVPGVTSSIAAPAYAGIPVTHRDVASSFAVVTGHTKDDESPPEKLPSADTLVFLMGVRALPKIVAQLRARGAAPSTPIALVRWGTTDAQQVVTGTLDTIESEARRAALQPPALIVVGEVVRLREQLQWFDNRPLWNQTIIVTRAREQASGLVEGLQNRGARVMQCPTIRVEDLEEYSALDAAIVALHEFDWIVFTSTNAVEKFWQRLRAHRLDARAMSTTCLAAIGPATAAALTGYGLVADLVPASAISESVAEGLLACCVEGQRVLIVRALESREVLETKLRQAGVHVTAAPCYRTVPDDSNAAEARAALSAGLVSWVTFTSSSTVKNFVDAVGAEIIEQARANFGVACIGPVTARTAEACGLIPDAVAPEASVESLIEILQKETR
ncbi:MAG TPA: uroporphyrinogen-III C-methyltransferase [Abditibacteriaceae bacterium]|nr:uroporphyrinogen-III C-methyltransferase [Abditibacteriaceae bacterium]